MPSVGPYRALGEVIRQQRELSRLSMRQFAERAGISNPYLSQIERGLREPSERVVDAIARSLETSADALYEQAGLQPDREGRDDDRRVRAAIESDQRLTARQRSALLEVYDGFVALNAYGGASRRNRKGARGA
jgi:transcriptional regulator with XRE-family HTH domain